MTKSFFLSIFEDYGTHWKVKTALRELLQNLIDGAIENAGYFLPNATKTG
jgi:hypothetical protein